MLSGSWDKTLKLWDVATGQLLRTLEASTDASGASGGYLSVAFFPDGVRLLASRSAGWLDLWDSATGELVRTFGEDKLGAHKSLVFGGVVWATSASLTHDSKLMISGSGDGTLKLWDTVTGQLIRIFQGHTGPVKSVVFSPSGTHALSGSDDSTLKLWDVVTGQVIHTFEGHAGPVVSVGFSSDGTRVVSGSYDTTTRIWDAAAGTQVATFIGGGGGDWVAMTPAGFFAASRGDTQMLQVVRGLDVYPVTHFQDHLYRADLVEALLKGDPEGKYADAASKLNLQTILDSGPAPQIETIPGRKTERIGDTIKITLRLVDTGGGIGEKVVWRVNGVTQGEVVAPDAPRTGYRVVEQTLKLAPGQDNIIEVTAYNGAGLLATTPWRHVEGRFGEPSGARMHVLAVGVSEYARKDWRLSYAANDAKAFTELMQAAGKGKGLYDDVKTSLVLETEATEKGIEAAIERMRGDVHANDVFILYLAGHGKNIAGTYYFLPQDLTFEGGRTIQKDAIDQSKLQRWLARIPAQKSILILDTCESEGAARSLAVERETAVERLRHATGRSVIAAASAAAYEGYQGHGLLTWAIRDAFTRREGTTDEFVELLPLAAYIDREVPVISQKWLGVVQRPHHKIEGNFPLGARLVAVPVATDAKAIPKTPDHVLIRRELVRERPAADAAGERELSPGAQVRLVRQVEQWAVIAREGQELGYVPVDALLRLQ